MLPLGKALMVLGALLFVVGVLLAVGARFGLGQLPGDISVTRGSWSFHAPLVTCIVLSIVLTIVLNLILRLLR